MGTSKLEEVITAAERVATALVTPGALERQAPCPAGADVRGCARSFASRAAGVAWGRPATAEEMGRLEQVFMTGAAESEASASYAGGISLATEAMLSSPHFVYRSELGQLPTDPAATEVTLDGPEIASAMSFLFRGARPDQPLLEAALAGSLADPETRAAHAARLVATPEGRRRIEWFIRSWLGLTDVADAEQGPRHVPGVHAGRAASDGPRAERVPRPRDGDEGRAAGRAVPGRLQLPRPRPGTDLRRRHRRAGGQSHHGQAGRPPARAAVLARIPGDPCPDLADQPGRARADGARAPAVPGGSAPAARRAGADPDRRCRADHAGEIRGPPARPQLRRLPPDD